MNNEDFRVVAAYNQKELTPVVWIGILCLIIIGIILSLGLVLVKNSLNLPVVFLTTQLTFWDRTFIMFLFFVGMFAIHELIHAITAWTFHIPTKFGWGIMGKTIPYFSVSLKKPVNRHQYIWIAIMPNLIINVFLAILILITKDEILFPFFVILFIMHIGGGGGDAALLYIAFKYPPIILLNDLGLELHILSKDDLEKKPLINQDFPIVRVFHENRRIINFFSFFLLVFIVLIILAPFFEFALEFLLGYDPNFFAYRKYSGTGEGTITFHPNFGTCFISSIILTTLIWIVRKGILKIKKK
ncbi:MAG: DUF3267 domain-containing protein [Candidatus Hodarchaeota archaeon]